MSVFKRKSKYGETREYHYKFMQSGKWYYGVCEGCTTERAASVYEKGIKDAAKKLEEQKTVGQLIENFKQELTGGTEVSLEMAFDLYMTKPRPRTPNADRANINRARWQDFVAFMADRYPETVRLDQVSRQQAEAYIAELRDHGRYIKETTFKTGSKTARYQTAGALSATTVNLYHRQCRSVFEWLKNDAGIIANPFGFAPLRSRPENRDAFTLEELRKIGESTDSFCRPLFMIGICTGLALGDACLLEWGDIQNGWIVRRRNKTGARLEIPILPPVATLLEERRVVSGTDRYVFPEHAAMYLTNRTGVSYRIRTFLERAGITTTRPAAGARSVSVKDFHSLRHTFAYLAGEYRIPLPIVQSVLGHMSPEMTKHYQAHADREAKEKYLNQLPDFLGTARPMRLPSGATCQEELNDLLLLLPPEKQQQVLTFVKSLL